MTYPLCFHTNLMVSAQRLHFGCCKNFKEPKQPLPGTEFGSGCCAEYCRQGVNTAHSKKKVIIKVVLVKVVIGLASALSHFCPSIVATSTLQLEQTMKALMLGPTLIGAKFVMDKIRPKSASSSSSYKPAKDSSSKPASDKKHDPMPKDRLVKKAQDPNWNATLSAGGVAQGRRKNNTEKK